MHMKSLNISQGFGRCWVKNCAKSCNSNNSTINQMSYIQQFLSSQLPSYYLTTLKSTLQKKDFLDFNSPSNIFTLTFDLLLLAENSCKQSNNRWLQQLITDNWLISYDSLQNTRLPVCDNDSEIVRTMKQQLKYVYNQMLQILIRLISSFLECGQTQYLNNTILKNLSEISYIYPALKIQIISFPEISLATWFDKYLSFFFKEPSKNKTFSLFLQKMKDQCYFIGPMEKIFNKFIQVKKEIPDKGTFIQKKLDMSSNDSEHQQEKQKQNKGFSDLEMFRKKKRRIIMDVRVAQDVGNLTPIKNKHFSRNTPKTQFTQENKKVSDSKSPLKKTPIFKKIKKLKKPLQRTLYNGQTKRFLPKKSSNSQLFIQNLTNTSLMSDFSNQYLDSCKKLQKKMFKCRTEDVDMSNFCVPETPRPQGCKKVKIEKRTTSMDLFRSVAVTTLKN